MSITVMSAVWQAAPYQGSTLLLLLALADFSDDNGVAFPSIEALARKTRTSDRSVQRGLRKLESDGAISIAMEATQHRTRHYQIHVDALTRGDAPGTPGTAPGVTASVTSDESPGVTSVAPGVTAGVTPEKNPGVTSVAPGVTSVAPRGDTAVSRRGDTALSPKPSITVIEPSVEPSGGDAAASPSAAPSATPPGDPPVSKPVSKRRRAAGPEPPTAATWRAYSLAYFERYGTEPVRNAKVNGQLALLVKRLGRNEAPHVAAFYVSHNSRWYVEKGHSVDCLLNDAEKLRTEWATGRSITNARARQVDRSSTTAQAAKSLIAKYDREDRERASP